MDLLETGNEHRHPWELSRGDCLLSCVMQAINGNKVDGIIADIGCGDLYFSRILTEKLDRTVYAIDTGFADLRTDNDKIIKMNDLRQLDNNCVDIAILMDVLEHVENSSVFLSMLSSKMSEKGVVFITVPAFQHLFSEHDVFLKHYRRYNRKTLTAEITSANFAIERMFYFYSTLYLLRLLQFAMSKLRRNKDMVGNITEWKTSEASFTTQFVRSVLNFDFWLNKKLGQLSPFGLSLCAFCRKR